MRTLVTGFGSDIAQAIIKRRLSFGDEVIATSTSDKLSSLVRIVPFELENPASNNGLLNEQISRGIDCLVLNAATQVKELNQIHDVNFTEAQKFLRANIEGNLWLIQKVLPSMIEKKFGRILFISSVSSVAGTSQYGIYCAAKAAIEGLIFNLAVDYGSFNIFSNVLRPGIIETSRTESFWSRPGYQKLMSKIIPSGSIGTAEQVAEATDCLLSPTSYINGAALDVSGGLPRFKFKAGSS